MSYFTPICFLGLVSCYLMRNQIRCAHLAYEIGRKLEDKKDELKVVNVTVRHYFFLNEQVSYYDLLLTKKKEFDDQLHLEEKLRLGREIIQCIEGKVGLFGERICENDDQRWQTVKKIATSAVTVVGAVAVAAVGVSVASSLHDDRRIAREYNEHIEFEREHKEPGKTLRRSVKSKGYPPEEEAILIQKVDKRNIFMHGGPTN